MPRTERTGSYKLQIDLAAPRVAWAFCPGDTIIGTVNRREPIVAPNAIVTIYLVGRVKTKITEEHRTQNGTRTEVHRGRWPLVDSHTIQTIHQGPLHLPAGSERLSWPFSVTIPRKSDESLAKGHENEETFLPIYNVLEQDLPGTFYSSSSGWSTGSECFVEYYLESSLRYQRGGSHEVCNATLPIYVQSLRMGPPSYELVQRTWHQKIQTQRLLPGMEHAELTFKQKTQKFFSSSKVPTFGFSVALSCSREIQLDNPSPFRLVITLSPLHSVISPNIKDMPQKIQLNWIKMVLKSTTDLMAPGSFFGRNTHHDDHKCHYHLGLPSMFRRLQRPVVVEITNESEEIDIGALFQLVLYPNGLRAGDQSLNSVDTIQPDFITYIIRHAHLIEWELSFTVAGETEEKKLTSPVTILPPSRESPNPPTYTKQ